MEMPTALPLHSISSRDSAAVGNKAARLGDVLRGGLPVPPGFVLNMSDCREIWRRGSLSAEINAYLRAAVTEHIGPDCSLVVRSSGAEEDGAIHTQTGALPTEYFVTAETLAVSILSCLSKAASTTEDCALIVQLLVPAVASGVLFTSGPELHNKPTMLIEAVWGLGRTLVDGKTDPDRFSLDQQHAIVERSLGRKQHEISAHLQPGATNNLLSSVSEQRQLAWTLNEAQLQSLARLANKCEDILGGPQDIEWALTNTGLCVLQSRPVSQAQFSAIANPPGEWLIFMPLLENFSEPLTPLSADLVAELLPAEACVIGGRIYLDAKRLRKLLPIELSQAQLSDMFLFKAAPTPLRFRPAKLLAQLPYWLRRGPWLAQFWLRSAHLSRAALRTFGSYLAQLQASSKPNPRDLLNRLAHGGSPFTRPVRLPFTLNLSAGRYMLLLGLVHALVRRWGVGELKPDSLAHLCSSSAETMSSEMVAEIAAMGNCVANNSVLAAEFRERIDLASLHTAVNTEQAQDFLDRYSTFIKRFGHRGSKELELASMRWVEDPLPLLSLIGVQARKRKPDHDPYADQLVARDDLHQSIQKRWQRSVIDRLLQRIRYYVDLREDTRHNCSLALFSVRQGLLKLANQLVDEAVINEPDDLFFLTWKQVTALQEHRLGAEEAAALVARSKKQHNFRAREPIQWQIGVPQPNELPTQDIGHAIIAGRCAAPGDAEGLVRVIHHHSDLNLFQPGEVLVTPYADPALAAAAQAAAALVCEYGSYLSHMGTLTREFGVPCVVDAQGATNSLRSGDRVRVRGSQGKVEMLAAVSSEPRPEVG